MVTEIEYLEAIKIINEYQEQIKKASEKALKNTGITKTPDEIMRDSVDYFPSMSIRLLHLLHYNFKHERICDITKKSFLSVRHCGKKSWSELCELTGKSDF